jgi:S1-C subfamily serine protease
VIETDGKKREANMSCYPKCLACALAVILACVLIMPSSYAQSREVPNVMVLRTGGAYLGITMADVTAENVSQYKLNSERGVIVRSVAKGSPAESAKLQDEDVILEFGGFQVWSSMQLSRLVEETPPSRKVDIVVSRSGKHVNLTVQLGDRAGMRAGNRPEILPWDPSGPRMRSYEFRIPDAREETPQQSDQRKPRLGITMQPLSDQLAEFLGVPGKKGILVSSVTEGSPSAGKLKSGDVIIGADGKSIGTPEDLTQAVRNKSVGTMTFKVIRDKKEITVAVNLPSEDTKGFKL